MNVLELTHLLIPNSAKLACLKWRRTLVIIARRASALRFDGGLFKHQIHKRRGILYTTCTRTCGDKGVPNDEEGYTSSGVACGEQAPALTLLDTSLTNLSIQNGGMLSNALEGQAGISSPSSSATQRPLSMPYGSQ